MTVDARICIYQIQMIPIFIVYIEYAPPAIGLERFFLSGGGYLIGRVCVL